MATQTSIRRAIARDAGAPAIRVAAVATPLWQPPSADAWVERFVGAARFAADGGAKLVTFGEYVTAPLLALDLDWAHWDGLWASTAVRAAREHRLAVCAGTHLTHDGQRLVNRCLVALPDGQVHTQDKLHLSAWERAWRVAPGDTVRVMALAGTKVAVLAGADIAMPEAARAAVRAGAEVLLVPGLSDDRQDAARLRHAAHARASEGCCGVVLAPLVGGLPLLPGFEQAVGSAAILAPCDSGSPQDGVVASGGWSSAEIVLGDLDLLHLRSLRAGNPALAETRAYRIA